MIRFPLLSIPVLALTSALLLAACGGGGSTPASPDDTGNRMPTGNADTEMTTGGTDTEDAENNGIRPGGPSPSPGGGPVTPPPPATKLCNGSRIPVAQTCPDPVMPTNPIARLALSLNCPVTLCGVNWTGETPGVLDRVAIPWPGGLPYDPDGPDGPRPPRDVRFYQFQESYQIREDDPATADRNERDESILLVEQDVRFAQYTVAALVDIIGIIRTGRDSEALNVLLAGANLLGSEINDILRDRKDGVPVAAFSARPAAQIVRARGISHNLRDAADEDVRDIQSLLTELAKYEKKATDAQAVIEARLTQARTDVGGLQADIATQVSQAMSKEAEITAAANEANRLSAELIGTGESGGLEIEWANLNRAIQALDQGGNPPVWDGENPPSPNCNSADSCRARLTVLGTFDSDTNTIVGGLVENKRMELAAKQRDLATFRRQLAAINAEAVRLREAVEPNNQLLSDLVNIGSEIAYWINLIAAAEATVTAQQDKDERALAALPDAIESTKAAAILTALEGRINAPGRADPATVRFVRTNTVAADLTAAGGAVFARNPIAESDSPPALYADYGMWLTGNDAAPVLETRLGLIDTAGTARTGDLTTVGTATYSGTARGLSARRTGDGDAATTASGHFTANVTLNATFGAAPRIGGTVTGFTSADSTAQGTAHVSTDWTIDLAATGFRAGTGDIFNAPFEENAGAGHPTDGGWSAYAYGVTGAPPTGVYGGFEANFNDGAAIGQFDTTTE